MSNGVPPSCSAVSRSGANANSASASMKRRISHAQAVRSTWQRGRVSRSMAEKRFHLIRRRGHRLFSQPASGRQEVVAPALKPQRALKRSAAIDCDVRCPPADVCS